MQQLKPRAPVNKDAGLQLLPMKSEPWRKERKHQQQKLISYLSN